MNQEKFGKLIKKIRKQNNMTQKEFANKYHVTYQAVSKWENGKNLPDMSLIKQISKDFNISIDDMINGSNSNQTKKLRSKIYAISFVSFTILFFLTILIKQTLPENDFEFRTISSNCEDFSLSGNISYNNTKSAIYITNIEYCGKKEETKYQEIECTLYESNNNTTTSISSYKYDRKEPINLESFLKEVTLKVDNYKQSCPTYKESTLYLSINAKDSDNKITNFQIPLSLSDDCNNN